MGEEEKENVTCEERKDHGPREKCITIQRMNIVFND